MNVPTSASWNARKTVLSAAEDVVPLSTAYHCRSTAVFSTAAGFLRQVLPLSFETDVPRLTSDSRSTKYSLPWSSVAMSVSPPPGPGSGLSPAGLSTWNERPLSDEQAAVRVVEVEHDVVRADVLGRDGVDGRVALHNGDVVHRAAGGRRDRTGERAGSGRSGGARKQQHEGRREDRADYESWKLHC